MLYAGCILSVLISSYIADRSRNKFFLFICALILSLFCGLRGIGVGVDTLNYYRFLDAVSVMGISYGSDIGFSVISYFLMEIFGNPHYPLLIFAFITQFLIVFRLWDFRETASLPLMLLIYMAVHYAYTFNIVRQFLAIAIIFWGTRYIERGENGKYFILNVLASMMHTSALLCFSLLFVTFGYNTQKKKHKVLAFGIALLCIAVGMLVFSANIAKYMNYFTVSETSIHEMTILKILFFLMVVGCNNVFRNKQFSISKAGHPVPMQKHIPTLYVAGLSLAVLGMKFGFMNRIGFYFMLFEVPFLGQAVRAKVNRNFYLLLVLLIIGYVLVSTYLSGEHPDNLFYYHTFLTQ